MKAGKLVLTLALAGLVAACGYPPDQRRIPRQQAAQVSAPPTTAGHSVREIELRKPAPPAPAPAAAPAPAVAPGPEPPARDYLIYFDFDKSTISGDSARVLEQAMEAMAKLNATGMSLIGHADRAGSNVYNQRLSERRAASVHDYLSGRAIPDGDIGTVGRGEDDPRVPTPDGVREQENRRVEIRLD